MKKLIAMLLALVFVFSFAGCGEKATAEVLEINLTEEKYAFGVDKNQPELLASVNTFISSIMQDGTFDTICDKYFGDGEKTGVTSAVEDASKDQLLVATNAQFAPFEYKEGDLYYGIDMEIAKLLADYLNMELVIKDMEFDAVCLSVGQHKSDIAMAGLTISEDRKEYVTFSDSYYTANQRVIVKSGDETFKDCATTADVEAILKGFDTTTKIGYQNGTTGQLYVEGDADWGFDGYNVTGVGYGSGALAVQDMLNGNVDFVIIDSDPAKFITEAINAVA